MQPPPKLGEGSPYPGSTTHWFPAKLYIIILLLVVVVVVVVVKRPSRPDSHFRVQKLRFWKNLKNAGDSSKMVGDIKVAHFDPLSNGICSVP